MSQTDASIDPYPPTIRPPVRDKIGQLTDLIGIHRPGLGNEAKYAAHELPTEI
jgi:hypothetical protein